MKKLFVVRTFVKREWKIIVILHGKIQKLTL